MRGWIRGAIVCGMVGGWASTAHADVTAFLGVTTTPENRMVRGFAGGGGLVVVAFEAEFASLQEDRAERLPGLTTGMMNVLLQTPLAVSGVQLYGTTGLGVYRERLGDTSETALAANLGGGAKVRVAGPLKVRLDYRLFRLRGEPLHDVYHRFYVGATLGF